MSILLKIESYCEECDLFDPETIKTALYSDSDEVKECNTVITCASRKRCAGIYKRIEKYANKGGAL